MQPAQIEVAAVLGGLALADPAFPGGCQRHGSFGDRCRRGEGRADSAGDGDSALGGLHAGAAAAGAEIFIEAGPAKVLTGLLRQIDRSQECLKCRGCGEPRKDVGRAQCELRPNDLTLRQPAALLAYR